MQMCPSARFDGRLSVLFSPPTSSYEQRMSRTTSLSALFILRKNMARRLQLSSGRFVFLQDTAGTTGAAARLPNLQGGGTPAKLSIRAKTGQEALEVEPHVALGSRLTPSVFGPVHAFGDQFKGCGIRNVDRGCASGRSDPAGQRQNRAAIWNSDFSPRRSGGGVICCVENLSA